MRFDGKVALVVGSSKNLGKAIARGFGKEGGSVVINSHSSSDELEETAREFRDLGINVLAVKGDITEKAEVDNLVQQGIETFDGIDCLVLSPRISIPRRPFLETTDEDWMRMQPGALATLYLLQGVIPGMLEKGDGRILSISGNLGSSGAGLLGRNPNAGFAATSRAEILRFVQREYGPQIRVNSISPGLMDMKRDPRNYPNEPGGLPQNNPEHLKQIPLDKAGSPEELAAVALFLLSDEAAYVNGVDVPVNGGYLM